MRFGFAGQGFVATTKPSAKSDGYAFTVDTKSGTFTRALGPLQGLSTLPSPNGKFILYSFLEKNKTSLAVFDVATHLATRLPLVTYTEKCTWSLDSASIYCGVPTTFTNATLDDWYQGASTFSDRLWRIDLRGREAVLLIDPKQAGNVDIDMVGLALDRTTDVLIFSNKRDGTFWMYDL